MAGAIVFKRDSDDGVKVWVLFGKIKFTPEQAAETFAWALFVIMLLVAMFLR